MKRTGISNTDLCVAVSEIRHGLIDADLGGHVLKKRIAKRGRGKSAGARTIVATDGAGRWFFVFGFNKNERSNISAEESRALRELAKELLDFSDNQLLAATLAGVIDEVFYDKPQAW